LTEAVNFAYRQLWPSLACFSGLPSLACTVPQASAPRRTWQWVSAWFW